MRFPRSGVLSFRIFTFFAIFCLFLQVSHAALRLSPSSVTGGSGTTQQFTVTGGIPPYTWSATVGSIGSQGAWRAAGLYAGETAYALYSIVSHNPPEGGYGELKCPVIDGVQWTTIKWQIYDCKGERIQIGYGGCDRPERTQVQFIYQVANGNPEDWRLPHVKAAGCRPCALEGFQKGVATVRDAQGATASVPVSLCNSDPNSRPSLVSLGDPNYKSNVGCPVSVDNGNMFTNPQKDLGIPARGLPLEFTRMYNSRSTDMTHVGYGWNHTYHRFLQVLVDGGVMITKPDGSAVFFQKDPNNGTYTPLYGEKTTLQLLADGTYLHREKDGIAYSFEPQEGHLLYITDPNGNALQLAYTEGLLYSVTDPAGRLLRFTYNHHQQVATLTDPAGRILQYAYDANDNLTQATYPDGTTRTYQYADPKDVHNLTIILDENSNEVEAHTYDNQDRAITSCKAGCRESVTLSFDQPGQTTATDSLGNQRIYRYDVKTGATSSIEESDGTRTEFTWDEQLNKTLSKDRRGYATAYTYDAHGNVLSETDPTGAVTAYTYDLTYNRPTSKAEPPTQVLPPSATQFLYDGKGNLTQVIDPVGGTTVLTYDSFGQLIQIDGPRTDVSDVTRFTYDPYGNLATITNPLDHVTQFSYDLLGNLLSVTDPNGNGTQYTYDLRDRPTQVTQPNGGQIQNTYDPAANLKVLTNPKGNSIQMSYNPINQLLELKDPLGNAINYTYDQTFNTAAKASAKAIKWK